MAPRTGLEPVTSKLTASCSTIELPGINFFYYITFPTKTIPFFLNSQLQSVEWPLQFLRTGYYHRSYGYLARTADGSWWSATAGSATHGRYLFTWTGYVNAQNNVFRGNGFALRCVRVISPFSLAKIHSPCYNR